MRHRTANVTGNRQQADEKGFGS